MFERTAPEQHDSLPDIPEPAENPLLVGHEGVRDMLARAYHSGKLHHALLLAGRRGIGKATLAFHMAHHLFTYPDHRLAPAELAKVDVASPAFRLAAQGAHPGLLHLTRPFDERAKKFRTVITVDEIRRVSRFLSLTPADGGYRVVIIDPAEDMNLSAANALLKNLEEPPPRTLFMLVAHAPGRLLPTIRSRCQVLKLEPLPSDLLGRLLVSLGAQLPETEKERRLLTEQAKGSVREAILMTQFGGLEIALALDRIISGKKFDVMEAARLADAAAGRERQIQFELFNRAVQEHILLHASELGRAGALEQAAQLASLWEKTAETIRQTEIFNLDRRQHVMAMTARLHEAAQTLTG
ncbi:DNA polymerase III subunit delta' [Chelativorans sp. Marseille-P2723]|uniref:DNA polymerase III subunit delta' n=1 Tax=Chelativorans sp. Marseille-P2723 TaxID=2709133 RepID=UPI001570E0A0|nr:DNA polymerase III subunit delta' [Chelativorans sp. Marseille-P2723]